MAYPALINTQPRAAPLGLGRYVLSPLLTVKFLEENILYGEDRAIACFCSESFSGGHWHLALSSPSL